MRLPQPRFRKFSVEFSWLRCLLLAFCWVVLIPKSLCQSSPEVDHLYAEAKAAQAAGDLATAIDRYQRLIQVSPRLAAAYNNLGLLYEQTRQYGQAIAVLKRSREIDPKLPSSAALLGIAYYQVSDLADARTALETAVRENANDEHAELLLAQVLLRMKALEPAAEHLRRLSKREPGNQEIWYLLGQTYMQSSEEALTRMNAINPNSVLVHEMSGEMMEDMKNYDGAIAEYGKAVNMAPNAPGTHLRLGVVYWETSQWAPALRELRAELSLDPANCNAHADIGDILLHQQQPQPALEELEKALSLCPFMELGQVDRGQALVQLQRYPDAITYLKGVIERDPNDRTSHFFLARAYKATGQAQAAAQEMAVYAKLEAAARDNKAAQAQVVLGAKEAADTPTTTPQ